MWHAKMKGKGEFFRCYSKDRDIFKLFARKPDEFSEISISWQIQFLLETQSHPLKEFPFIVKQYYRAEENYQGDEQQNGSFVDRIYFTTCKLLIVS